MWRILILSPNLKGKDLDQWYPRYQSSLFNSEVCVRPGSYMDGSVHEAKVDFTVG